MRNRMSYTLGEAAKVTGKNKTTIQRAIKDGKLSATRNEDGSYSIDPAELHRVYPLIHLDSSATEGATGAMQRDATHSNTQAQPLEFAVLEERLRSREEKIRDLEHQLHDVEEQRDQWHAQAERLTLLLTAPRQEQPATPATVAPQQENPQAQPSKQPTEAPYATPKPWWKIW